MGVTKMWMTLVLFVGREIGPFGEKPNLTSSPQSHRILAKAWDMALYSDLIEYLETQSSCFLFQEIRAELGNIH